MKHSSLSVSEMSNTRCDYRYATVSIHAYTDRCTWRRWLSACWYSRHSQNFWAFLLDNVVYRVRSLDYLKRKIMATNININTKNRTLYIYQTII